MTIEQYKRKRGRTRPAHRLGVAAMALWLALGMPAARAEPPAVEAKTIEWYLIDLPPIQIATGKLRGQGYSDRIRWRLIAGLPEYRHVLRVANVQRILADIAVKPNVCNPSFLRTPTRERFMVFADPLHAQFPNGAVVLKKRRKEFERFISREGVLALDALLEAGAGTVVVQSGRSYGVTLDGLIDEARDANRLITLTANGPVKSKLGLLKKERAEVALLYPYELSYHLNITGERDDYDYLPVIGNGDYTLNYLACSRSELGEEVVARANRIIATERDGYFSATYRAWLPSSLLKLHETHHHAAFGTALRPVPMEVPPGDDAIASCLIGGGAWFQGHCERAGYARADD